MKKTKFLLISTALTLIISYMFLVQDITVYAEQCPSINPIQSVLDSNRDKFGTVIDNASTYELQILYTKVNRDSSRTPTFETYKYNVNDKS